ncbi:MAG: LPS export ABC transporter periplasmic protein LptC [Treponema sp.]|jgi:LPS export ABC transporter protein LptC|nr:LPS export ABC transporter periplasmic protein LptC [Treponema sp.]
MIKMIKGRAKIAILPVFLFAVCGFFAACSFDYGNAQAENEGKPDLIMLDVEYVRVRNGDPIVRFQAESAERYEEAKKMNLNNFSFEEYINQGTEVNTAGSAGEASVDLDSGNISLAGGVKITVESEGFVIETSELHWLDKTRQLSAGIAEEVLITRSDGTRFIGRGFSADARYMTWVFESGIEGVYVED